MLTRIIRRLHRNRGEPFCNNPLYYEALRLGIELQWLTKDEKESVLADLAIPEFYGTPEYYNWQNNWLQKIQKRKCYRVA